MVHDHGAIHVYVHQRTTLIQHGRRKRDTKFQGHQGQTALAITAVCIEGRYLLTTRVILTFVQQLVNDFVCHEVLNGLPILSDHALSVARHRRIAVQILESNLHGIFTQRGCDFFDHRLNAKHTLGAAKTAKRGGALRVGLTAVANDVQVGQVIAVVNVQDRTVIHRA